MNYFDPQFLQGFIKRCHEHGCTVPQATRLLEVVMLRDPDVARGYQKRAFDLPGMIDQGKQWWGKQDPRVQGGLVGAGIGGLLPLLFGGQGRFSKALIGSLLGGAAGAGGTHLYRQYQQNRGNEGLSNPKPAGPYNHNVRSGPGDGPGAVEQAAPAYAARRSIHANPRRPGMPQVAGGEPDMNAVRAYMDFMRNRNAPETSAPGYASRRSIHGYAR